MNLKIIAVGTKMPGWVEEGCKTFSQRIRPMQNLELIEVPLAKRSQKTKASDVSRLKQEEAEAIERRLKGDEKVVVLDVEGKPFSTHKLAQFVSRWQMEAQDVAILIGGPDGLDSRFLSRHYEVLSLSTLTLPHPLVRLVLIEQIYRALAINANHPYHRD